MAWTVDQANIGGQNASVTSATTITLTTNVAVAAGSWVFLSVGNWDAGVTLSSAADNGPGLTWSIVRAQANGSTKAALVRAYAASGMASGAVITATFTGATGYRGIGGASFAGGGSGSVVEEAVGASAGTLAHSVSPIAGAAGSLIVQAAHMNSTTSGNTPDANSTELIDWNLPTGPQNYLLQYRLASGSGATTIGGTWGGGNAWAAAGGAFSDASTPPSQFLLPDADLATAGWSTAPLFSKLNDESDSTVISATCS